MTKSDLEDRSPKFPYTKWHIVWIGPKYISDYVYIRPMYENKLS